MLAMWCLDAELGQRKIYTAGKAVRTPALIFCTTSAGKLPWYLVRQAIADGALQRVLEDHALPSHDIHAVYPSPKLVSKKTTHFIEFLQQSLMGEWWASGGR